MRLWSGRRGSARNDAARLRARRAGRARDRRLLPAALSRGRGRRLGLVAKARRGALGESHVEQRRAAGRGSASTRVTAAHLAATRRGAPKRNVGPVRIATRTPSLVL